MTIWLMTWLALAGWLAVLALALLFFYSAYQKDRQISRQEDAQRREEER